MADDLPPPYTPYAPTPPGLQPAPQIAIGDREGFDELEARSLFVSGAPYFEMRPPVRPEASTTVPIHILVSPETSFQDLPFSEPQKVLEERDVHARDWKVFVDHIILCNADQPLRKVDKSEDSDVELTHAQRRANISAAVSEWNKGFFHPRGLEIIVTLNASQSPTVSPSSSNYRHQQPRSPSSSHQHLMSDSSAKTSSLSSNASMQSQKAKTDSKTDPKLGNALYLAVSKQDIPSIRLLLQSGADPNFRSNSQMSTLAKAVEKGNEQIAEILLEHGVDVNISSSGCGTALNIAVSKGQTNLVSLLLVYNADPNRRPWGTDPNLCKSISKGYDAITSLLLHNAPSLKIDDAASGRPTALQLAAKAGNVQLVKTLLGAGAQPDAHPMGEQTAMRAAATRGDMEMVRLLLQAGAQVDAAPTGQNTAMWSVVAKNGDEAMVRLLLEHGADVHAKTWGGDTVLERAVKKGKVGMVELLLQHKPGKVERGDAHKAVG
ncbi:MAG: hypothetical protein Q9167_005513 [Letrouitia subvulpina]